MISKKLCTAFITITLTVLCFGQTAKTEFSENLMKKAMAGDPHAQFDIGKCFRRGLGVLMDLNEAKKWLLLSANQSYGKAEAELGAMYFYNEIETETTDGEYIPEISIKTGKNTNPENTENAKRWFLKAIEHGETKKANCLLGYMYRKGIGLELDPKTAFEFIKTSAENGFPEGQRQLGLLYEKGEGVKIDPEQAFKWTLLAANNKETEKKEHNGAAQSTIAFYYSKGFGVQKSEIQAFIWDKKSAENEWAEGQYNLAQDLWYGKGVQKNPVEALKWYDKAAKKNYPKALFVLGLQSAKGEGMDQSFSNAAIYYTKAADLGNREAQNNLGTLYKNGTGVQKNINEAFRNFLRASIQSNEVAYANLGDCYLKGEGVEKNPTEAIKW